MTNIVSRRNDKTEYSPLPTPSVPDPAQRTRRGNVKLMLVHAFSFGICDSICRDGGIFDTFLYEISGNSNQIVGSAETLCGVSELAASIFAGVLADRYHNVRARLLKRYSVMGAVLAVLFCVAVNMRSLDMIRVALALYGAWVAFKDCTAYALIADSAPETDQGGVMAKVETVQQFAAGIGPLVTIAVMTRHSGKDEWQLPALQPILTIGAFGLLFPAASLWFWEDVPHRTQGKDKAGSRIVPSGRLVPALLCLIDLLTQLGMGMTVKFIPLYFKDHYGLHPTSIAFIYVAYAFGVALATNMCRILSSKIGRVRACIACSIASAVSLVIFAYAEHLPTFVIFFLLKGSLCNAVVPLDRSLVLDAVPAQERGRWAALESLGSASWSGSAFLGGMLADSRGGDHRFAFKITAAIYAIALLLRVPLLRLVHEGPADKRVQSEEPSAEV